MKTPHIIFKILRILLIALSILSGTVKVVGVRIEFMKITHVGFDDWKITIFGMAQIAVALLLAFRKSFKLGAVVYSLLYASVTWHYFNFDLQPKIVPIILAVLPILMLIFKSRINSYPAA